MKGVKFFLFIFTFAFCFMLSGCRNNTNTSLNNNKEYVTVTFNSQGGTTIDSQQIEKGSNVSRPNDPLKEGFVFDGWFVDDEKWSFVGYVVTKDITITAKWNAIFSTSQSGNEISIIGLNYNDIKELVIPETIDGYKVTSIGSDSFSGCTSLTSITIPNSVESIGDSAFLGCRSLTSITIPDSVTSIGSDAFFGCTSLTKVNTNSIESWCNIAFTNSCSNPLYYAHNLYLNDELIIELVIPNSVTSIGNYAFSGCTSLTSITIPDSVTSIGSSAFSDCPIEEATIPAIACSYIKNSILKTVIITSGTSIGSDSFSGCTSLTSITIPDSVKSIGSSAFDGCTSLIKVNINSIESWCNIAFSNTVSNPLSYAHNLYLNDELITELVIPNCVTSIGSYAFSDCTFLTSITIPDSVISIGTSAFSGCTSLTSITIPDSVTSIGSSAFSDCPIEEATIPAIACSYIKNSILKTVVITSGASIGSDSFSGCTSLTSITIPDSVISIGDYAFRGCKSLTKVNTNSIESWCNIAFSNTVSNPLSYAHNLYLNDELITELVIPDCVTSIGNYAFFDCTSLTSITIPDSVTSIGNYAFSVCTSLTNITIPEGVTSIRSSAFSGCTSLTSIIIPDSVISIGSSAFSGCTSLTSIIIPDSVTSIENYAFSNCPIEEATIPAIACSYVKNSKLKTVVITSGTSIVNYAFSGCTSLTSITIPDSVTSIGSSAFYNCTSLTIYCEASSKPSGWDDDWNRHNRPVVWGYKGN